MGQEYVIDCAGRRIPVGDRLFAAKCWKGNSTDFLKANSPYVLEVASAWTELKPVSIVIPIYRSGAGYLETVRSLYNQKWKNPDQVEFILYINQPPGAEEPETATSIETARALLGNTTCPDDYWELAQTVQAEETPLCRLLVNTVEGGLGVVYRQCFSTLVARLFNSVINQELDSKEQEVTELDSLYRNTYFIVVDDDLIFPDRESFPNAISELCAGETILLGRTVITAVASQIPEYDKLLCNLMNVFLQLKYATNAVVLPPRGAAVADLFHLVPPEAGVEFAEQIWFSAAAKQKQRIFVPVQTTLEQEEYPSNARMTTALARYLASGENPEALEIFENVRQTVLDANTGSQYKVTDVDELLRLLRERNIAALLDYTDSLLQQA